MALATTKPSAPYDSACAVIGGGDDPGDHREDHQALHVVDDRGAENDARLVALRPAAGPSAREP